MLVLLDLSTEFDVTDHSIVLLQRWKERVQVVVVGDYDDEGLAGICPSL